VRLFLHFVQRSNGRELMRHDDETRQINRAEKARLHRKRVQALERRQQQKSNQRGSISRVEKLSKQGEVPWQNAAKRDRVRSRLDRTQRSVRTAMTGNMIHEDDFDDDCCEYSWIGVDEVSDLLRAIERHRQALRDAATNLQRWLSSSPGFAQTWHGFTAAGGVSADDFERFLDDRMRYRPTKRKRHLRLIVNNKSVR
jgi:hypothetical protein